MNFVVMGPSKDVLVMEPHSKEGLHGLDIKETGEYEICVDNSFSRMTDKLVFFDLIIEDDSGVCVWLFFNEFECVCVCVCL